MLETLEKMSNGQKDLFKDVANKLLANTFLSRDKRDTKDSYYFLVNFKEIFDEFFHILGYSIRLDANLGSAMIESSNSGNLLKLKRDESVILLILRILYHEKMKETSLNENVVCAINDIHIKYDYLEIKKKINKTDLVAALRLFRRFNLIEIVGDIMNSQSRIVIFPTILMAIDSADINAIYQTITNLTQEANEQ